MSKRTCSHTDTLCDQSSANDGNTRAYGVTDYATDSDAEHILGEEMLGDVSITTNTPLLPLK